jgi:hypothetical protein
MATIRNGRISTTFKYAKISGVPELYLESLEREYSDQDLQSVASVSSSASTRAAQELRKISRAEGCFVTKQPGYYLERAHWVNALRKDATLKLEVVRLVKIHSQSSNEIEKFFDSGNLPQRLRYRSPQVLARCTLQPRSSSVNCVSGCFASH